MPGLRNVREGVSNGSGKRQTGKPVFHRRAKVHFLRGVLSGVQIRSNSEAIK